MLHLEILRWSIVTGVAAALLRRPRIDAAFWALAVGRPFVVTRERHRAGSRLGTACPD